MSRCEGFVSRTRLCSWQYTLISLFGRVTIFQRNHYGERGHVISESSLFCCEQIFEALITFEKAAERLPVPWNNTLSQPLISRTNSRRPSGELNVSRRQQTCLQEGPAARLSHGGNWAGDIRCIRGSAQGWPSELTNGAGDATAAVDPRSGDKTFRARRASDHGCASIRGFA